MATAWLRIRISLASGLPTGDSFIPKGYFFASESQAAALVGVILKGYREYYFGLREQRCGLKGINGNDESISAD
jgi:hypothetical protein